MTNNSKVRILCDACNGNGGDKISYERCHDCRGHGYLMYSEQDCQDCGGTGYLDCYEDEYGDIVWNLCAYCGSTGRELIQVDWDE